MPSNSPNRVLLTPRILAGIVVLIGLGLAYQFAPSPPPAKPIDSVEKAARQDIAGVSVSAGNLADELPQPLGATANEPARLPSWYVPKSKLDELIGSTNSERPRTVSKAELQEFPTLIDSPVAHSESVQADSEVEALGLAARPRISPFSGTESAPKHSESAIKNVAYPSEVQLAWPDERAPIPVDSVGSPGANGMEENQQNAAGGLVSSVQEKKIGATLSRTPRKKFFVYQPGMTPEAADGNVEKR